MFSVSNEVDSKETGGRKMRPNVALFTPVKLGKGWTKRLGQFFVFDHIYDIHLMGADPRSWRLEVR